ncbi:MAG: hypothetical protein PHW04_10450 [Candidatus Wallbacteria bacterium]|nr:hypothetical protein [Candidatus Wallbacteria bacterium]
MNKFDELIMVIPKSAFDQLGCFQGFNANYKKYVDYINEHYEIKKRGSVENDPNYKQIIPYALLTHDKKVCIYKRGKQLSEERLKFNYSLGFGGHISFEDSNLFNSTYKEGMLREVNEELKLNSHYQEKIVGLINDDSNDVGKVHLGIVHVFNLTSPEVRKKEKSINEVSVVDISFVKDNYNMFETWSQICIDNASEWIGNELTY